MTQCSRSEALAPRRARRAAAALAALFLAAAAPAAAGDWKWSVTPYAWASDVGAELSIGKREVADEEIPFTELLDQIEMVGMVRLEAKKGEHGAMLDMFDVVIAEPYHVATPPAGTAKDVAAGDGVLLGSEVGMTILELGGTFDPRGDGEGLSLLYGARVLDQRIQLDTMDLEATPGSEQSREAHDTLVDGMVGIRWDRRLSKRFGAQLRADVSAGDTELTWSGQSALSYAFGESGRYALQAGYRYLAIDFQTDESVDLDMTLSGFHAGLRASF